MKKYAFVLLIMFSSVVLCDDNDYTIDRIDWEKLLNKNTHVSVENLYGNILIKKSYSNSFAIHAVNQNHKSNTIKAKFKIEEKDNSLSIKIVFDKGETTSLERSDISLAMPKDMPLLIKMNGGKLTAKKIMNPITVKAESAEIFLTTKSQFNVFSKTGEIYIKILEKSKPQQSNVQSFKGNIILEYLTDKPYFEVLSGKVVVSNSVKLLMTKRNKNRHHLFNQPNASTKINIINDIGNVILIDKNTDRI